MNTASASMNAPHSSSNLADEVFLRSGLPYAANFDGAERFSTEPQILAKRSLFALYDCAEGFVRAMDELCSIIAANPQILRDYFHFGDLEEALWNVSALEWKGISRADVFFDEKGATQIVELNSDTPSGMDEALNMDAIAREQYIDPWLVNNELQEAWTQAVLGSVGTSGRQEQQPITVAIVYPTDVPEDMGLLLMYRRWLEQAGCRVILCAPHNLALNEHKQCVVFGEVIDILYRHYKTDWWLERKPVWKNSIDYPSKQVLGPALNVIAQAMVHHNLSVVNSFATLLTQNKLCLAFMHEELKRFSQATQDFISAHVPLTHACTEELITRLRTERGQWVLKSVYGCEGADVIIGTDCSDEQWQRSLDLIISQHWIAQRFVALAKDDDGCTSNYGVYLCEGKAAGVYLRRSIHATDNRATVAPVIVRDVLLDPQLRSTQTFNTQTFNTRASSEHDSTPRKESTNSLNSMSSTVAELVRSYQPQSIWRAWYLPLVLYSAPEPSVKSLFHHAFALRATASSDVQQAATQLWSRVQAQWGSGLSHLLCIVDLEAHRSLHFVWAIENSVEPVLQSNTVMHARGVIDMAGMHAELLEHAGGSRAAKQHRVNNNHLSYPPCFMLDARRLAVPRHLQADQFNNCWIAQLPSAELLLREGIQRVVYVCEDAQAQESDDLHADLREWQKQGIEISRVAISDSLGQEPESNDELQQWWKAREMKIEKRQTIFSYMFEERVVTEELSAVV